MGATGQAPLKATVLEMERLRCNGCGQLFTATEPEGVGLEKYDATAAAMIAQLRYGSGVPFKRLERRQANLGIPLPAATQWELIEEAAEPLQAAVNELVRQAAQGEVMHNDDTAMRILRLARRDHAAPLKCRSGFSSRARGQKSAGSSRNAWAISVVCLMLTFRGQKLNWRSTSRRLRCAPRWKERRATT